jgi:L-gulonate 5-dehydrogenase
VGAVYRAAVWTGKNRVEVQEKPLKKPGPGEVLLKIKAAGICGTDMHILSGAHPHAKPPLVPGHEFAGEIVETGSGVDKKLLGVRAGSDSYIGCGKCVYCLSGKVQLCDKGTREVGIDLDGGWAEYIVVPEKNIYRLPDDVEYFQAGAGCILNCPMAAVEMVGIKPGDTVLIIGDGPSSLVMLQLAGLKGAAGVIVAGHREKRLGIARQLGADFLINTHNRQLAEEVELFVMNAAARGNMDSCNTGPDVVIDAVGKSETFNAAVSIAAKEGRVHLFGLPEGSLSDISMEAFLFKELKLTGSTGKPTFWATAMDYLSKGYLNVDPIISHRFSIDRAQEAIDFIRENPQDIVKAIFEYNS